MKKLLRITTVPISLDILLGEQLSFMNAFLEVTAVSSDKVELKRVAEKYGVKYHPVEMTRTISPLQDLKALWQLYRFLRREKPEIVHSHTPKAGIVAMMAAWFAGVPHRFHTVAGLPLLETKGLKRMLLNFVEKLTYRFATKVYSNSFKLREIIVASGFCAPDKIKVLANGSTNGIDCSYFSRAEISADERLSLRTQLGIAEDDFVFIFVGRLVRDKGIDELVSAFKSLNSHRTLKLLLVGPPEQQLDPLKPATLQEIETNPRIISVGFQKEVRPYFAISDCLVFPSYREGFPNVVLQSLAMGLPAIVTDINGCNEIVEHQKNGFIIPVKDEKALGSAMENILHDREIWRSKYGELRQKIAERYSQQIIWQALLNEYSTALGKRLVGESGVI